MDTKEITIIQGLKFVTSNVTIDDVLVGLLLDIADRWNVNAIDEIRVNQGLNKKKFHVIVMMKNGDARFVTI